MNLPNLFNQSTTDGLSVCFESFAIVIGKTKVVYILIPQTCEYVTSGGKRGFAGVLS